jgi:hypothetical protein
MALPSRIAAGAARAMPSRDPVVEDLRHVVEEVRRIDPTVDAIQDQTPVWLSTIDLSGRYGRAAIGTGLTYSGGTLSVTGGGGGGLLQWAGEWGGTVPAGVYLAPTQGAWS